jgi:hypothetical protein
VLSHCWIVTKKQLKSKLSAPQTEPLKNNWSNYYTIIRNFLQLTSLSSVHSSHSHHQMTVLGQMLLSTSSLHNSQGAGTGPIGDEKCQTQSSQLVQPHCQCRPMILTASVAHLQIVSPCTWISVVNQVQITAIKKQNTTNCIQLHIIYSKYVMIFSQSKH